MRITNLLIKNYRCFDPSGQSIDFPTPHTALVGKNNAGKSNIFNAVNMVLGSKNPTYLKFEEEDYFDPAQPIEIKLTLSDIQLADKSPLMGLPHLTKPQQGALNSKISAGSAEIVFFLRTSLNSTPVNPANPDTFDINLWGFNVFRKKEEIRSQIIKLMIVPAVRKYQDELSASKWTTYGQLMKEVLENSGDYQAIKSILISLNRKIEQVFQNEKAKLLQGARTVSYVDDINFQLTKDNNPSELLRNLEIFIKENQKVFNIEYVGTGTQSAIIIGILELALKSKNSKLKLFCIEEPEAFIHPHGIRYLGTLIKSITEDLMTQVIVSTHSISLVSHFEPKEIIRVSKDGGKTIINQDTSISSTYFKRFIHQDNAELFFSERVLFVEGDTEKQLLCNLDKETKQDSGNVNSNDCNFDRINLGIIKMDSANSILNYVIIAKAFNIGFAAMLDKDFLNPQNQGICQKLCTELGVTYQISDKARLIQDLKNKNILVNTKGEVEDLFADSDISRISGKPIGDIVSIKAAQPKSSKAFKQIFGMAKPEYAIKIADYYVQNHTTHPLDDIIRKIYLNDIANISI